MSTPEYVKESKNLRTAVTGSLPDRFADEPEPVEAGETRFGLTLPPPSNQAQTIDTDNPCIVGGTQPARRLKVPRSPNNKSIASCPSRASPQCCGRVRHPAPGQARLCRNRASPQETVSDIGSQEHRNPESRGLPARLLGKSSRLTSDLSRRSNGSTRRWPRGTDGAGRSDGQ